MSADGPCGDHRAETHLPQAYSGEGSETLLFFFSFLPVYRLFNMVQYLDASRRDYIKLNLHFRGDSVFLVQTCFAKPLHFGQIFRSLALSNPTIKLA